MNANIAEGRYYTVDAKGNINGIFVLEGCLVEAFEVEM
jgi:hypothetical protein